LNCGSFAGKTTLLGREYLRHTFSFKMKSPDVQQ
jgi:hypothetical protein